MRLNSAVEKLPSTVTPSTTSSPEQIEANRSNARRSTGPVTEQGKARSSQNARAHGLCSRQLHIADDEETAIFASLQTGELDFHARGHLAAAFRGSHSTVAEYLLEVLPGLASRPISQVAQLTPTRWAAARSKP